MNLLRSHLTRNTRALTVRFALVISAAWLLEAISPVFAGTGATTINESLVTKFIYVSTNGSDVLGNGATNNPYRTISNALSQAKSFKVAGTGVKISIAPGVYREGAPGGNYAMTFNGSTLTNSAPLIIEGQGWNPSSPTNTGQVIIDGADVWSGGWTNNGDGTWSKAWPFALGVPSRGSIPFAVSDAFLRREMVHVNGQTFYQLNPPAYTNLSTKTNETPLPADANGARLTADEGAFWVVDGLTNVSGAVTQAGVITIKMPTNTPVGFDLNADTNLVEVTTKRNSMQFWIGTQSPVPTSIIFRNLTLQHWGASAQIQYQNNFLFEDCRYVKNKRSGLGITPGQNVTLRRCEFSQNGESGAGITTVSNALLVDCQFNDNSRQGEILNYTSWSVCGIKLMRCSSGSMIRCSAINNRSTGVWWDSTDVDCEMVECILTGNSSNGAFIENNNSTENDYDNGSATGLGPDGIVNLGSRPTVTALRSIFAHNRPAPGTASYRSNKARGVFYSETENAVVDSCLIYGNEIQISTYDNNRGENRNFTFRNNLIASLLVTQRLFAVGGTGDSKTNIVITNSVGTVVTNFKGGWFGFFDGLSATTDDNRYYYPSNIAFYARAQRYGTLKWATNPATLSFAGWRAAHLTNSFNNATNKAVDSRSTLSTAIYDERPYVVISPLMSAISQSNGPTAAFAIYRVTSNWDTPLTVTYLVRTNAGDATNGLDYDALPGSLTIPAGQRSAAISLAPRPDRYLAGDKTISLSVDTNNPGYLAALAPANLVLTARAYSPVESWRALYFQTLANTGPAADGADPDGDGLPNLLEFALGRNPTSPDSLNAFTAALDTNGKPVIAFDRARADMTYYLNAAGNLTASNWNAVATNPGVVGSRVLFSDTPSTNLTKRFFRLRATLP